MANIHPQEHSFRRKGFTLIALAIILAVAGLLLVTLMQPAPVRDLAKTSATGKKLKATQDALKLYNSMNGALPAPASRIALVSSANFGTSLASCPNDATCTLSGDIWIGAVPTRELNLPDNYAFDEWGNRFTYAMDSTGKTGITLNDRNGNPKAVVDSDGNPGAPGKVSAVIISHGKDGAGSYTWGGAANTTSCTKKSTAATSEKANCDGDATFVEDFHSTSNYLDDFGNYLLIPPCNKKSTCFGGLAAGDGGINIFRVASSDSSVAVLNNYTNNASNPWWNRYSAAAAPGHNSSANGAAIWDVQCSFLKGSRQTGCVVLGKFGDLMAVRINPNTGISSSSDYGFADADTNGPTGGNTGLDVDTDTNIATDWQQISCANVDPTNGNKLFCMATTLANSGSTNAYYQLLRVDFSQSPPTITMLSDITTYPNATYKKGAHQSCVATVGNDEVMCLHPRWSGFGGTVGMAVFDFTNVLNGAAIGNPSPIIIDASTMAATSFDITDQGTSNNKCSTSAGTSRINQIDTTCAPLPSGNILCTAPIISSGSDTCSRYAALYWNRSSPAALQNLDHRLYKYMPSAATNFPFGSCWPSSTDPNAILCAINAPGTSSSTSYLTFNNSGVPVSHNVFEIYRVKNTCNISGSCFDTGSALVDNDAITESAMAPIASGSPAINQGMVRCSAADPTGNRFCIASEYDTTGSGHGVSFSLWKITETGIGTATISGPITQGTTTPCPYNSAATCALYQSNPDLYYKWNSVNTFANPNVTMDVAH